MQNSKLQFKIKNFTSGSESETLKFAEKFVKGLRGGEIIALNGELGAGKTVFTKGLAKGLGIKQAIHSPTFVLMKIYRVRSQESDIKNLVHVDAYRLMGADELVDIGFLDWLGKKDTVAVIEWADKVSELLKRKKVIKIKFKLGKRKEERTIKIIK